MARGFTRKERSYFRVTKDGEYATAKQRRSQPASHFLDTKNKKYPYKNPDGSINCRLLRAAIRRAGQYHHPNLVKKGQGIYAKNCAKKK